ncbi:MAG: HlyD family secretion protein, partial [Thermoanaerobaculia bacterium]
MKRVLLAMALIATAACRNGGDDDTIQLNGRIEAPTVDLGPKVPGRVVEVLVREGDRVQAGALLVRLDLGESSIAVEREIAGVRSAEARAQDLESGSRESEIAVARAEVTDRRAAVSLAQKEAERQRFLLDRKVGTQRDADRARTELERARAALKVSQEKLELAQEGARRKQTEAAEAEAARAKAVLKQSVAVAKEGEIRAPADGVIIHRLAEPGQLVSAGQPAITLAFANRLFVRTFIPETKLGRV